MGEDAGDQSLSNEKDGLSKNGFPWDTSVRLQGTVTAFKHRRGYGFVLAEGYTKKSWEIMKERLERDEAGEERRKPEGPQTKAKMAKNGEQRRGDEGVADPSLLPAGHDFFFTRGAMGGGFYITEGEHVSFRVKQLSEKDAAGVGRRRRHRYVSRGQLSDDEDAGAGDGRQGGHLFSAIGLRRYDPETGEEGRILPVAIQGVVTAWDAVAGVGTISELDVDGNLHDDAPTFTVLLEDVDLSPVASSPDSYIDKGRYVKFCVGSTRSTADSDGAAEGADDKKKVKKLERPRALRVILDINMERKCGVVRPPPGAADSSRSTASSSRRAGSASHSTSVLPQQRGVIREMVERKYGFVVDDATGESIFFHVSEMVPPPTAESLPQVGDCVTYDVETIHGGRHAGKKHCVRVRLQHQDIDLALDTSDSSLAATPAGRSDSTTGSSSTSSKSTAKKRKPKEKTAPKSLLDEFDLLD